MVGEYILLQCLLWLTTLGFIMIFDYIAKKRIGVVEQGYINLRLPKFIALIISSVTTIISLYVIRNDFLVLKTVGYLSIPYFAAISYFITAFFRELKYTRTNNTNDSCVYPLDIQRKTTEK